jgi:hypothetical protein
MPSRRMRMEGSCMKAKHKDIPRRQHWHEIDQQGVLSMTPPLVAQQRSKVICP